MQAEFEKPTQMPPEDVLGKPPVGRQLDEQRIRRLVGRSQVRADHPEKPFQGAPCRELMNSTWEAC